MGTGFGLEFYVQADLTKNLVEQSVKAILAKGGGFWHYNPNTKEAKIVFDRCPCFTGRDGQPFPYKQFNKKDDLFPDFILDKEGKNPKFGDCIKLVSKYGGAIGMAYNKISFDLCFNNTDPSSQGYTLVIFHTDSTSQITHSENAKQNLSDFVFLADGVWQTMKPFFCTGGIEIDCDIKKIEVGDELKKNIGFISYFHKDMIEKIGREKIVSLANKKIQNSVKEFSDGSLRVMSHDYGTTTKEAK